MQAAVYGVGREIGLAVVKLAALGSCKRMDSINE